MSDTPSGHDSTSTSGQQPPRGERPGTPPPGGRGPIDPRGVSEPPPPPPGVMYYPTPGAAPRRGGMLTRIGTGLVTSLLLISLLVNVYLGIIVYSMTSGPYRAVYAKGDGQYDVVVIPIRGIIDDSTAAFVRSCLISLTDKHKPSAIVLRVDSGGGMVQPSDIIYHRLKQYRAEFDVPIVASFGQIAASGGYYVAAGADVIMAEPTTVTGSIGVLSMAFTVDGLLEKIGVTPEVMPATDAPEKDVANNMFRSWTERDREAQRQLVDAMHVRFVDVVAEGRQKQMTRSEVEAAANGATYMLQDAMARKLVDQAGYLDDAIAAAADLAAIPPTVKPDVWVMQTPPKFGIGSLFSFRDGGRVTNHAQDWPRTAEQTRTWLMELSANRLMYYHPMH